MLLGMHQHLGAWWADVVARGGAWKKIADDHVIRIDNNHWTKADKRNLDWTYCPRRARELIYGLFYRICVTGQLGRPRTIAG